jgi:type IV secretion system protein VirB2
MDRLQHRLTSQQTFTLAFTLAGVLMVPTLGGAAAVSTPMGDVLCAIASFVLYGNLGRGLAVLAVIFVGVGASIGKVSWGMALTVGIGLAVMFGAPTIVTLLGIPVFAGCP